MKEAITHTIVGIYEVSHAVVAVRLFDKETRQYRYYGVPAYGHVGCAESVEHEQFAKAITLLDEHKLENVLCAHCQKPLFPDFETYVKAMVCEILNLESESDIYNDTGDMGGSSSSSRQASVLDSYLRSIGITAMEDEDSEMVLVTRNGDIYDIWLCFDIANHEWIDPAQA